MKTIRSKVFILITTTLLSILAFTTAHAAKFNPVVHQVQTQLAEMGYHKDVLDGIYGPKTRGAIRDFQRSNRLPITGKVDRETLAELKIGTSPDLVNHIENWRDVPTASEIAQLTKTAGHAGNGHYANYAAHAPGGGLDLPGQALLDAMNRSADQFGTRRAGELNHTDQGHKGMLECLTTGFAPTHWSDITLHYYCQLSYSTRACYTGSLAGAFPDKIKYSRKDAFSGCAQNKLTQSDGFQWVASDQPLIFQYLMFAQTNAFKHDQEQAIINAFYGVKNPADKDECNAKRPRRTEDPKNGTHCLVNKMMNPGLIGRSR